MRFSLIPRLSLLSLVAASSCARFGRPGETPDTLLPAERVELTRAGWRLVGDLTWPPGSEGERRPAVLLLNRAAGSRAAYVTLAAALARRGVASLRLDLSAHGESTNLGQFIPGQPMPAGADAAADIGVALAYLRAHARIDTARIAVVGASYSGEAAISAARSGTPARLYALLSPGSLSDSSIAYLNTRPMRWLYVASRTERSAAVHSVTAAVEAAGGQADLLIFAGPVAHATDLLSARPDLAELLASWLTAALVAVPGRAPVVRPGNSSEPAT